MTRVTQASNGGNTVATKRVDFAYNALGQFTTIDRYQNTGGTNNVAQTTFAYDTLNRLTDLDHKQNTTTLAGYDYTYDRMNRLATITGTVEGLSTFTHDKTSQLTGGDHAAAGAPDETYTYDANGNRTMTGYTTTTNNLTTSDGTYNYEYDDEGNRTKKTTISTGAYEEYTWDHRNRLTKVTFKDSSHTVLKTVEHQYDIANRWTRRHTDPDGPGATAARDNFFAYDGIEPILQFDGAADTDLTDRYLWGPTVDQILADEQVTSLSSAGNIIWPLTDHLGTARDLADQNESAYTTTVTNHRTYNGFGLLIAQTNSSVLCAPGYTGKIQDDDTGLQNNWNRWYDTDLGKWTNEDPIGFGARDANLNRYVSNSPVNLTDPTGLLTNVPVDLDLDPPKPLFPPPPVGDTWFEFINAFPIWFLQFNADKLKGEYPDARKVMSEVIEAQKYPGKIVVYAPDGTQIVMNSPSEVQILVMPDFGGGPSGIGGAAKVVSGGKKMIEVAGPAPKVIQLTGELKGYLVKLLKNEPSGFLMGTGLIRRSGSRSRF